MFVVGYVVAMLLRLIQNRRAAQSRQRVSQLWGDEMEPVELKIEVFGLGRYMGQHCDKTEVGIPLDIFEMMSERYGIPLYELMKPYVKGVADSAGAKNSREPAPKDPGRENT